MINIYKLVVHSLRKGVSEKKLPEYELWLYEN